MIPIAQLNTSSIPTTPENILMFIEELDIEELAEAFGRHYTDPRALPIGVRLAILNMITSNPELFEEDEGQELAEAVYTALALAVPEYIDLLIGYLMPPQREHAYRQLFLTQRGPLTEQEELAVMPFLFSDEIESLRALVMA